ncbi:MTH1187 family thiamine-binding protein [Fuchsiella alkaliacetigena]|uniref:MTH1187 family thiamine-binding protein n=1 Tax=Fuchsiella alkaliacetigena TaxID=957042 RepID=UPI002009E66F|nr:MTH1187 family thiamine-binding protein [Fuchsiella alkaliacetigena]MCK8823761.1 MTH1187 family thiamine-binding protein [Fuchsiella alkaliacetigena]
MAIVEVTVVPLGTEDTSLSEYVADCQQVLAAEEEIEYQLTPMGTIIEGDLDEVLAVVRKLHEVPFQSGAKRVSTSVKIDDRRDRKGSMKQKVSSVENKLK